jgi:methionine-rich copper-binding protein CopC
VEWLRPLAPTGALGLDIPTRRFNQTISVNDDGEVEVERELNAKTMQWGFSLQYNLQYLQSFVRDVGLPAPFNRTIPVVEFAMQTPIEGPRAGHTTGTINPGPDLVRAILPARPRGGHPRQPPDRPQRRRAGPDPLLPGRHRTEDLHVDAVPRRAGADPASVTVRVLWAAAVLLVTTGPAWGHAFPNHSEPRVEHTVDAAPPAVRIWFDGAIEPIFSTLRVEDADKRRVDRNDARVSPADRTLLEVSCAVGSWGGQRPSLAG